MHDGVYHGWRRGQAKHPRGMLTQGFILLAQKPGQLFKRILVVEVSRQAACDVVANSFHLLARVSLASKTEFTRPAGRW